MKVVDSHFQNIKDDYNQYVLEMESDVLNLWNKKIVKEYMKNQQIESAKKKKKGWLWSSKLDEEEKNKIEEMFDNQVKDNELDNGK